jgi:ABC-type lipoprotein release transport system permease subunit
MVDAGPGAPTPATAACEEQARAAHEAARALNGDLVVAKSSRRFTDHAGIAAAAVALGAVSADVLLLVDAEIEAPGPSGPKALLGLTPEALARLAPYVGSGSLDRLGSGDVALGEGLGLKVGDVVALKVAGEGGLTHDGPNHASLRVAALMHFPPPIGVLGDRSILGSIEKVRALAHYTEGNVDGISLRLRDPAQALAFKASLEAQLPPSEGSSRYRVIDMAENDLAPNALLAALCPPRTR